MPVALMLGQVKDNLSRAYANVERYLRSNEGESRNEALTIYNSLSKANSDLYEQLSNSITDGASQRMLNDITDIRKQYNQMLARLFELAKNADNVIIYEYMDNTFVPSYRGYRDAIDKLLIMSRDNSNNTGRSISNKAALSNSIIVISIVAGIFLAVAIAVIIIRSTNAVLTRAISSIDDGSSQVAAASTQVSSASNMLAEGASEQAASLEETSSSLEEMSSMTARNAASALEAKGLADEMRSAADQSAEQMREMKNAMDAIKESSSGISQIIKTIDEIAFQTNILALNAAVEAARAGEAGAGFAVVAEEVRNLAQRSANSAKETSVKIEGAIRNSDRGVAISAKVSESLDVIVHKARGMNQLVAEIATASQEQDKGIGQLTTAVTEMDKVTQSNASNAEETASAAEELNSHADSLKETVADLVRLVRKDTAAGARMNVAPGRVHTHPANDWHSHKTPHPTRQGATASKEKHFLPMGR